MTRLRRHTALCAAVLTVLASGVSATEAILPQRALVIGGVLSGGRATFPLDPIQHQLVTGQRRPPSAGDRLEFRNRTAVWREVAAARPGVFQDPALRGGYALVSIELPREDVFLLEASGHSMVYVNGEPRVGNPYGYGYVRLPVRLRAGRNEVLFACGRGELSVKLAPPPAPVSLSADDATLPDLVVGQRGPQPAAVLVVNASSQDLNGAIIEAQLASGAALRSTAATVPALSVRKVPFRVPAAGRAGTIPLTLRLLVRKNGRLTPIAETTLQVQCRLATATRKCTFLSDIDGSVQYYAVVPPRPEAPTAGKRTAGTDAPTTNRAAALTLTCHGAGVEAIGQAASYAPKRSMYIVAPTNRRPFGFDWEEWGRMDALEVLNLAQQTFHTDPARTYLTGHSMGGHGAWHLAVTFPNRFAAVGPSAGWISFRSYAGAPALSSTRPVEAILSRAASGSDTLALATNLKPQGVYILHGDADDNVPVSEARRMFEHLRTFHTDVTLHEEPGAGHWWGAPSDPGTGCVDWPAMFDLFQRRVIPRSDETRIVEFATVNPGVSSEMRWLLVHQQIVPLARSYASIRCDPVGRRFVGKTENIAVLELSLLPFAGNAPVHIELDGAKLTVTPDEASRSVFLAREGNAWKQCEAPTPPQKGPGRSGPFKEAFSHRFVLVYGTCGNEAENAWARAKALYDAETFWYRGNGSPDVIPDSEFRPERYRDRSVILYGNADTNRAWPGLLRDCPVAVRRGVIALPGRRLQGDDLACLFCYPRRDSDTAYVAAVSGTGLVGMRLTDRAPYFTSGTAFPDILIWTPRTLLEGPQAATAAGFFGADWSLERGEMVVQQAQSVVTPSAP